MTDRRAEEERLREAFQSLSRASLTECSEGDLDLVWRAVSGQLPADQRRDLVDRMASDPACAEAWRVAHHFWQSAHAGVTAEEPVRYARVWTPSWLAVAATVCIGIAVAIVQFTRPAGDEFRDQPGLTVEALTPAETLVARDAVWLRWKPGPPGSRYTLRVTTEDLQVLTTARELTAPEYRVEPDVLSKLPPGTRILWQLDVALPGGEVISSQTFAVRVQ